MRRRIAESIVGAAIAAFFLFSAAVPAVADGPTFTVNSQLDQIDDDVATPGACHTAANTCTLRAAIMEANRSEVGATIVVPAGLYLLTIPPTGSDGEASGDLNLTTPASGNPVISIVGAGAESSIIDGNQTGRVLAVAAGRTASISGVTIRNGFREFESFDNGGGIFVAGTLTLSNVTVSDNYGAVGGGIYAETAPKLTIRNSTISGNRAGDGAGIFNRIGVLVVENSTISQNYASGSGGGLYNAGTANVYNTTIAFNGADVEGDSVGGAGGIYNVDGYGAINLRNSLLAGNFTSFYTFFDDCAGTLTGYGENLFQAALASCALAGSWDFLNDPSTLGPLQDNGGPTWTHALLPGSNAIDGTSGSGCVDEASIPLVTDQRGAPRVTGLACDVGAFEVPEPDALIASAAALATVASMRRAPRGARADHA